MSNNNGSYKGHPSPDDDTFASIGEIMKQKAGSIDFGKKDSSQFNIDEYLLGDMSSTVNPVRGGLEDWAYAAAWDQEPNATVAKCSPKTYPLESSIKMSFEDQKSIRAMIYLIEMDYHKKPPEWTLGGRSLFDNVITGIYNRECQYSNCPDGHINRNIRMTFSMLEAISPWIEVLGYSNINNEED